MQRREAIDALAANRGEAISVATMLSIWPWHQAGQANADHVDAFVGMGSASALGLGIAVARPDRPVLVLDGDGSLLMQLGSLATIAGVAPANFYHVVFDNGLYETSGSQATPGAGMVDFAALALGAGYRAAFTFESRTELEKALPTILGSQGPVLLRLLIEPDGAEPKFPPHRAQEQIETLRARSLSRTDG